MPPRAVAFARAFAALTVVLFLLVVVGLRVPAVYRFWTRPLGDLAIPHFVDAGGFLAGADVVRENGGSFSWEAAAARGEPFNYPRLWAYAGWLGLGRGQTVAVGVVFAALLLGGQFLLLRPGDGPTAAWSTLMLLSPASLLLLDRANNDVVIFALVLGATSLLTRRGGGAPAAAGGGGLLLAAACLKLYPIAAVAAVPLRRGRWRWTAAVAGAVLALFAVYVFAVRADLREIAAKTPRAYHGAYGALVPATFLAHSLELRGALARAGVDLSDPARLARGVGAVQVAGLLAALALGGGALLAGVRSADGGETALAPGRDSVRFRAGAAIYGGTFLIGNNFDYRLVFLSLTVPLLFAARRRGGVALRRQAGGMLALIVVSLWAGLAPRRPWSFGLIQFTHWTLFALLAHLGGRVLRADWGHGGEARSPGNAAEGADLR